MIRSAGFKRAPARPAKQYEGVAWDKPRQTVVCVIETRNVMVVPIERGPKAKPGKRTPTKDEAEWMDKAAAHGCVACRQDGRGFVAPQIHHILSGGRRMGHLYTLPLCPDHHQDSGREGYVARHPWKARFEMRYGSEMHQLMALRAVLS